ncbi:unnamed protein product [Microthlaspi erraticum]|uniref:Uncharacterized protein n=1 Tax=Microthlaspi erraticum TaxID=1685480 RepID=A0A6D2IIF0_9BRAS|nr:unnamed protein product [Microthlaspi erraticum]
MMSPSRRNIGVYGFRALEFSKVPLEDPRSSINHYPEETDAIRRCLVEIPASLTAISLPRAIRPIVNPGLHCRVSHISWTLVEC